MADTVRLVAETAGESECTVTRTLFLLGQWRLAILLGVVNAGSANVTLRLFGTPPAIVPENLYQVAALGRIESSSAFATISNRQASTVEDCESRDVMEC